MQKLFFSDVDNTLVVKGQDFTENLKESLKMVQDNGDEFVFCSGRPLANLISIGHQMRSEGINLNYVSGFNGGTLYNLNTDEIIYENGLTLADTTLIANKLNELEIDFLLYDDQSIIASNPMHKRSIWESELTNLSINQLVEIIPSTKVLGLVEPEDMDKLLLAVKESLTEYEVCNSTPFFIEITRKNVNKGSGLLAMQRHLNVKDENCYAFGDAMNDYEMFNVCHNAYAVENAVDEVKFVAKDIIGNVESDGVAKYLKTLYN